MLSFTDEGVNIVIYLFPLEIIYPYILLFLSKKTYYNKSNKNYSKLSLSTLGKRCYSTKSRATFTNDERSKHINDFEPLLPKNIRISPTDLPESKDYSLIVSWIKLEYPNIKFNIKTFSNIYLYSVTRSISREFKGIGLYFFTAKNGKILLIGESTNLGSRAVSYLRPSYLESRAAPSLRYFHCYGFNDVNLTLIEIPEKDYIEDLQVNIETKAIKNFIPLLNVLLNRNAIRDNSGVKQFGSLSLEQRLHLREITGTKVYLYSSLQNKTLHNINNKDCTLLYVFSSITMARSALKLHNTEIKDYLLTNTYIWQNYFLSPILIEDSSTDLMSKDDLIKLVASLRGNDLMNSQRRKKVIGLNLNNLQKSKVWDSLLECSKDLEIGSRDTIRNWCKLDKHYNFYYYLKMSNLKELNLTVDSGNIIKDLKEISALNFTSSRIPIRKGWIFALCAT